MDGPQVFSRPGSKRHLAQVRARSTYLTIQAIYATADAHKAQASAEAASAAKAAAQAALDSATTRMLNTLPVAGNA